MNPILFCDFFGVLSYNKFWQFIYHPDHWLYPRREEIGDFVFFKNNAMVKEWMRGKYSSEDIHKLVEKELDIKFDDLFPIFVESSKVLDISRPILDVIKQKKELGYRTVLVTDNMDSFSRYTKPNNRQLIDVFDGIFDSSITGLLKQDENGKIFRIIASNLGGDLSKSILVDDSKATCELFESLGGKALCVTGEENVLTALALL